MFTDEVGCEWSEKDRGRESEWLMEILFRNFMKQKKIPTLLKQFSSFSQHCFHLAVNEQLWDGIFYANIEENYSKRNILVAARVALSSAFQFSFILSRSSILEIQQSNFHVMDSENSFSSAVQSKWSGWQFLRCDENKLRRERKEKKFLNFVGNTMFACWCSEMIYYTCNIRTARFLNDISIHTKLLSVSGRVLHDNKIIFQRVFRCCRTLQKLLRENFSPSLTLCFTDHLKI